MSEKYRLSDYDAITEHPNYDDVRLDDPPPSYTLTDQTNPQQKTKIKVDTKVFHSGARFDEFAKPSIPPPPPGCPPNQLQQIQMEKGKLEVVLADNSKSRTEHHYENRGFSDDIS